MLVNAKKNDYIPTKCEGWNGKFVYGKGAVNNVSKVRLHNQNVTDTADFYGVYTEPTVLPVTWDGTFAKSAGTRLKMERNRSDDTDYYQCNNGPTWHMTPWNGEFVMDPNDIRIKPERNFSDSRDYAGAHRFMLVH